MRLRGRVDEADEAGVVEVVEGDVVVWGGVAVVDGISSLRVVRWAGLFRLRSSVSLPCSLLRGLPFWNGMDGDFHGLAKWGSLIRFMRSVMFVDLV